MSLFLIRDEQSPSLHITVQAPTKEEALEQIKSIGGDRPWNVTEDKSPTCCPKCGGKNIGYDVQEWFAHSLDECDLHNTAKLTEHHCRSDRCGISFWL